MTDYVNPSNSFTTNSEEIGRVFRYSGHAHSFIADGVTLVSDVDSVGVTAGPLNAFAKTAEDGLDVTFDTGEGMIQGALLARDTQTTVTLSESSTETVYLAWDPSVENGLIIDTGASGNTDGLPRTSLYEFTTDTSGVTDETDLRELGEHLNLRNSRYETSDNSGQAVDQADNASNLGGDGPNSYAQIAQNENISGNWTYTVDVDFDSNDLQNVNTVNSPDTDATILLGAGLADLSVQTGGGGDGQVRVYDNANGQPIADFDEGGGVSFPNGDLETRRGWMVDHESPITIEKNGTDGQNTINFKTE